MKQALLPLLMAVADGVWRRRFVLFGPLLVALPLLLLYLQFGPRPYVAKSLLLVQENSRDNPLAAPRELQVVVNMQERIMGLQALLKSDRVLNSVMLDIAGDKIPTDRKEAEQFKKRLGDALTLDLVGNDFLQLQLKAMSPKDLGRKLESVVSRFIEALLPAQDVLSAMQVLVERRKEELDAAELDFQRLQREIGPSVEDTLKAELAKLSAIKGQLDQATADRDEAARTVAALRRPDAGKGAIVKTPVGATNADKAAPGETQKASVKADPKEDLRQAEARLGALDKEIQALASAGDKQKRRIEDLRRVDDRYQTASAEVSRARRNYDTVVKRFNSPLSAGSAPNILNAPERIKIIDLPRDPVFPATSGLKIVVLVTAALLLLSAAVAVLLELLDPTVRRADQFEQLTGLPVLARIPWPGTDPEPET